MAEDDASKTTKTGSVDGATGNTATNSAGSSAVRGYVAVAAIVAALGSGALYLTSNPVANPEVKSTPKPVQSAAQTGQALTAPADAEAATVVAAANALPQGPGKNPLSVGEMATFVFKPPQDLPDVAFVTDNEAPKSLTDWRGKVVLVNLWATWCGPCREEMPDLDRLQAKLGGNDFEVVAISLDRGSPARPKKFLSDIGAKSLAFYQDPTARLGHKLKAIGMPATVLLDRNGREIGRLVGPAKWDSDDAVRLIKTAIERTRTAG